MKAKIEVLRDSRQMRRRAAEVFLRSAVEAAGPGKTFNVALSGGTTPKALYRLLADESQPFRNSMPWKRTHFFWTDERYVPRDHADNNYHMAWENMLARVPAPTTNIHRMPTEPRDPGRAAERYESFLRRHFSAARGKTPCFDLILLGMGADGHTASLFSGSAALEETKRLVLPVWVEKFQSYRLTLTVPVLNNASKVLFLVSGKEKARAAARALSGGRRSRSLPAKIIRPRHGELLWLLDREAASLLPRRGAGRGGFSR